MQTLALWAIALALFAIAPSIASQPSYKQEALFISGSLDKIAEALMR
jgi:hypothetical protein